MVLNSTFLVYFCSIWYRYAHRQNLGNTKKIPNLNGFGKWWTIQDSNLCEKAQTHCGARAHFLWSKFWSKTEQRISFIFSMCSVFSDSIILMYTFRGVSIVDHPPFAIT